MVQAPPQPKLTLKQERFVSHYLLTGNGTESAIAAGYSPNVAAVQASENLRKPNVQLAIADRKRELAAVQPENAENVVTELWKLARDAPPGPRVAALRTLAEIYGLTSGRAGELPAALTGMLEALGRGIASAQQASRPAIEATAREVAELNGESGKQGG